MDTEHTLRVEPRGAGQAPVEAASVRQSTIRVRDLPGFIKTEDAALLWGGERLEQAATAFTEKIFGVVEDDLDELRPDDGISVDPADLPAEMARHQRRLLVDYLADDETVDYLLSLGFDLRDERGQPLRATYAIAPVIEAVARGLAGHPPDIAQADVESFSERIEAEAKAFMRGRRR